MKVVIIAAMERELDALCGLLGSERGRRGGNEFVLVQGGMGKVNAACACTELIIKEHPDCIISSGCAGGLSPDVEIMDVVVGREYCYHDVWCGEPNLPGQVQGLPARFQADKVLCDLACSLPCNAATLHEGLICTGDRFCTAPEEVKAIAKAFPEGLALDMESAALAQVCHLFNVPFLSIRIISDSVSAQERTSQYEDFWASVSESSFQVMEALLEKLPNSL